MLFNSNFRFFLLLVMAATAPIDSSAAKGIEMVREVLLESGTPATPSSIARAPDGGYIITGRVSYSHAWAAKTDAEGNVLWRYALPIKGGPRPGVFAAHLTGGVHVSDGGTLLCGYDNIDERSTPKVLGLLVQIDKGGHTVSETRFSATNDEDFRLNYIRRCIRWGEGFAVVGTAPRLVVKEGRRDLEYFYWLLALDAKGKVKWEKLIPDTLHGPTDFSQLLVLKDQDLVFSAWRSGFANPTEVVRVNPIGEVKARRRLSSTFMLVRSLAPDAGIQAISLEQPDPNSPRPSLLELGPDLADIGEIPGRAVGNVVKQAYLLSDHSIALFGSDFERGTNTASIVKLSSDLQKRQAFRFQPQWVTYWAEDAVPTGKLGEFATVRGTLAVRGESRSGVLLAFVRIH